MADDIIKPERFTASERRQRQIEQVARLIQEFTDDELDMAAYLAEQLLHELKGLS